MLHPRNIVVVGATDKPGNYAERIWNNLIKYKFEGGLYPLNARRETIWGVPCYKDFASLPDTPDHVIVMVPARFAAIPLLMFSAPYIIMRNTLRGRRIEKRRADLVMMATVIAGLWSLMSGTVVVLALQAVF